MDDALTGRWVKKFRTLTLALIFSGALNIGLIAAFVSTRLQDDRSRFAVSPPAKAEARAESTTQQFLAGASKLTFHELVPLLTNREPVEEGFAKRDLGLAALVTFHHFNVDKALSGVSLQKRIIQLGDDRKVEAFPGLNDSQFEAIIRFAYEEKWPLTSLGIFNLMKKLPEPRDPTLEQAFLVTPEFHALQVLFQKTEAPQEPQVLLKLAAEGNWDVIDLFAREQAQLLDLSVERRRRLLLSYVALKSPTAAQLLLRTDFSFVAKRLEDKGIVDLLALCSEKTADVEKLCVELLRSPRTDAVWQAAALRLYALTGEAAPEPFDLKAAMARFAPAAAPAPVLAAAEPAAPTGRAAYRQHVVKEGESLWKIARLYKAKVDEIVKLNELEKDKLYPGMTLQIPHGTGSEPPR